MVVFWAPLTWQPGQCWSQFRFQNHFFESESVLFMGGARLRIARSHQIRPTRWRVGNIDAGTTTIGTLVTLRLAARLNQLRLYLWWTFLSFVFIFPNRESIIRKW
jgi:hypothetical protein